MTITDLDIPGLKLVAPKRMTDERGFLSETYSRRSFAEGGVGHEFVQDNHSFSRARGTVRGLHFQIPPFAQDKLVRCARGAILDVAVDIRRGSPTYGAHVAVELSVENWRQLFVPAGFAHGFCTLQPDTEVIYKLTAVYSREHEKGVVWNDPDLAIAWPVTAAEAVLSGKDAELPAFADLPAYFEHAPSAAG